MKKLFILLALILFAFISCNKEDDDETKKFKIDGSSMIYIKPSGNSQKLFSKSNTTHLSALEIVKLANNMRFFNDSIAMGDMSAGFAGKDTISAIPAFLRYGSDVINEDGFGKPYLVPDFVYAYDCVIEIYRSNKDIDTIAYIPNAVFRQAQMNIEEALIAQDTASVYTIFNNAFTFIPITGAEYKELKRLNLQ